ncbi:hypothetical protein RRG08_052670 [Elysia crispata]|uniref:Uncharacterized protein n=1 Tax=Elysia crispata TaxID=231223 RepID=A0AAE1AQ37_9GAST|nr:hypothetical protein RRG08_052670 [Elysia crispata]
MRGKRWPELSGVFVGLGQAGHGEWSVQIAHYIGILNEVRPGVVSSTWDVGNGFREIHCHGEAHQVDG